MSPQTRGFLLLCASLCASIVRGYHPCSDERRKTSQLRNLHHAAPAARQVAPATTGKGKGKGPAAAHAAAAVHARKSGKGKGGKGGPFKESGCAWVESNEFYNDDETKAGRAASPDECVDLARDACDDADVAVMRKHTFHKDDSSPDSGSCYCQYAPTDDPIYSLEEDEEGYMACLLNPPPTPRPTYNSKFTDSTRCAWVESCTYCGDDEEKVGRVASPDECVELVLEACPDAVAASMSKTTFDDDSDSPDLGSCYCLYSESDDPVELVEDEEGWMSCAVEAPTPRPSQLEPTLEPTPRPISVCNVCDGCVDADRAKCLTGVKTAEACQNKNPVFEWCGDAPCPAKPECTTTGKKKCLRTVPHNGKVQCVSGKDEAACLGKNRIRYVDCFATEAPTAEPTRPAACGACETCLNTRNGKCWGDDGGGPGTPDSCLAASPVFEWCGASASCAADPACTTCYRTNPASWKKNTNGQCMPANWAPGGNPTEDWCLGKNDQYLPCYPSTAQPSNQPSKLPTNLPTNLPSKLPTNLPTNLPSKLPTNLPSNLPSKLPTNLPTPKPSPPPSSVPTELPTLPALCRPTPPPGSPTAQPTPNDQPTLSRAPTGSPTSRPSPESCPGSSVFDCNGQCCPQSFISEVPSAPPSFDPNCETNPGDCAAFCDYGGEPTGCDFSCEAAEAVDCPGGVVADCSGSGKCPAAFVDDKFCDGPSQSGGCDLSCYPNEICAAPSDGVCPANFVPDCDGGGDCCPLSWIGDGFCDDAGQTAGCDLSCYCDEEADCVTYSPTERPTSGEPTAVPTLDKKECLLAGRGCSVCCPACEVFTDVAPFVGDHSTPTVVSGPCACLDVEANGHSYLESGNGLSLTDGDDCVRIRGNSNTIYGQGGADTIVAIGDQVSLYGDAGDDTLFVDGANFFLNGGGGGGDVCEPADPGKAYDSDYYARDDDLDDDSFCGNYDLYATGLTECCE